MSRRIIDLNGRAWLLGQAPPEATPEIASWDELAQIGEWLPAVVPGNVRADLIRAGHLPDLVQGRQAEETRWVDDHSWWLIRDFRFPVSPDVRVHLVLRGVDYVSDLFLNGDHLGRHEGMFSPQIVAVTGLLGASNRLAVRIVGSKWLPQDRGTGWERLLNHLEARTSGLPGRYPHRRDTLKCQMGFGWDFAPPIRPMGIWDDVYLVACQGPFIRDVVIRQQILGDAAEVMVHVDVDARQGRSVELRCTLRADTFDAPDLSVRRSVQLERGSSRHKAPFTVHRPRLWWPWDHGRPDLYRLDTELWEGTKLLDSATQLVGLRQVELDGLALHINGRRVYARGANWVPADILPGRVTESDYRALLTLAREANMNMLRVWGGGLREKRAFYDLCDRFGIALWQEFPIACAFLTRYPRSPDYLRLVDREARAIVRDLRNHPSVVLWCGGNEFKPERNAPLVDALGRAVAEEDPTRPFLPASPAGGDRHNWHVWHNFQSPAAYRDDTATFASEFGLQAPPDVAALHRFITPDDLWPPGQSWTYHGAGLVKLRRYARPFLDGREETLVDLVQASQRSQAHALQIGIEHFRRRKARGNGGVLVWQFNEPWPAISWALLDFARQPKPAYDTVKRLLNPVLVSLDYALVPYEPGDRLNADIWIINDRAESLPGCRVEVVLRDRTAQPAEQFGQSLDIPAGSAKVVGSVRWILPTGGGWRLSCFVTQGGQVVTQNEYDLTAYDGIQPTLAQRLRAWLGGLVSPL